MQQRTERGVVVDYCRSCNGLWLDSGELEALERDRPDPRSRVGSAARTDPGPDRPPVVEVQGLCPRCQDRLEVSFIGAVEVDRCPRCGGTFFDHGELPTVLRLRRKAGLLARLRGLLRG